VVFILLMFFLVATTLSVREQAITVKLPESTSGAATESPSKVTIVTLQSDGTILLNGETVPRDAVVGRLRAAHPKAVRIRGDGKASLQAFTSLYDLCARAGIENITLGTVPEAAR